MQEPPQGEKKPQHIIPKATAISPSIYAIKNANVLHFFFALQTNHHKQNFSLLCNKHSCDFESLWFHKKAYDNFQNTMKNSENGFNTVTLFFPTFPATFPALLP